LAVTQGSRSLIIAKEAFALPLSSQTTPSEMNQVVPAGLPHGSFSLIQSAFTFDNIPGMDTKVRLFRDLRTLLKPDGVIVNIVSEPEIYCNEWSSFSTKDFPENRNAKPGDPVKIVTTDFEDRSPAVDILWPHESYLEVYGRAGLEITEMRKPLANGDEPYLWVSETRIAPWAIYVLRA
jgi:hypothetical protein